MIINVSLFIIITSFANAQTYYTFDYDGETREYYFYLPDNSDNDAPLVMGFYGYALGCLWRAKSASRVCSVANPSRD